jgi:hypothetical protein
LLRFGPGSENSIEAEAGGFCGISGNGVRVGISVNEVKATVNGKGSRVGVQAVKIEVEGSVQGHGQGGASGLGGGPCEIWAKPGKVRGWVEIWGAENASKCG